MPPVKRGLMRRRCWHCTSSTTLSNHQAVLWVMFTNCQKMEVSRITPNSTHCSLTKKRALQPWTMKSLWFVAMATKRPTGRAPKKGEVPPPPPNRTHCPPHQQGSTSIVMAVVPTEGRQKYKRPLGSRDTHKKGGFPIPSPFDASPLKGFLIPPPTVHVAIRRSTHLGPLVKTLRHLRFVEALQENSQNFPYGVLVVCVVRLLIGFNHRHGLPRELLMRMPAVGLLERHKKRSGIPIAPSGSECVARGRTMPSESLSSPTRRSDCGCDERFPRKDPGVFDLLGSSLSCDATVLAVPISICTYGLPNLVESSART